MSDEIILKVNNQAFKGWTSAQVEKSLYQVTGAFGLATTDKFPGNFDKYEFALGDACTIEIAEQIIITGYVEDTPISYDASNHNIQVGGRDKTGDLVDCSFIEDVSEWKGQSVANIVKALCKPFDIDVAVDDSVTAEANTEPKETFSAQPGMSVFEMMMPMLKIKGILPVSYGDGKLILTRAGTTQANDTLEFGVNIKSGSINQSTKDRFRDYVVFGQGKGDDDKDTSVYVGPKGTYTDEVITRYRSKIILPDDPISGNGDCTKLAKWEALNRAGASVGLEYEMQGWTQSNGDVWPLNSLVRVKDSFLGIDATLLIAAVIFNVSNESGTITRLVVVDPKTFDLRPTVTTDTVATKGWRSKLVVSG